MLAHSSGDQTLQRMLDLRKSLLASFNPSNGVIEEKGNSDTLVELSAQDTTANDFCTMSTHLNSIIEISNKAENELEILKSLKVEYQKSLADRKPEHIQKEKYKLMVDYAIISKATWDSLEPKLPFPKFQLLKKKLQALSSKLEKINSATIGGNLLKLYKNEKELNEYLLRIVDEKIIFIQKFKEKLKNFQARMQLVDVSIQALILKKAEKHAENLLAAQERLVNKIEKTLSIVLPKFIPN